MANKINKTNALRLLDKNHIDYKLYSFSVGSGFVDGVTAAGLTGLPPERVFKTLATVDALGNYFIFVIPVARELDLKKAAQAAGVKSIQMLKSSLLMSVTGYVKGGCSPVGMKKRYATWIDATCLQWDTIAVSGGKPGLQVALPPKALIALTKAKTAGLTADRVSIKPV